MNAELATQPQPVQKGKVLPPEIHKALQKWSNSLFRPSIPTNLMDKSTVTEINDERAKLLTAEFLYGERNGALKDIPYDGSEITNRIDNLDEESLWLYGGGVSGAPAEFSEKSQSKFSISTGKTRKCPKCRGEGEVDCFVCKGTGKMEPQSCSKCSGKGCRECGRTGKVQKACPMCKGSGTRRCGTCDGYKNVHTVIEVKTRFKVEDTKEHDYQGEIPAKKLKNTTGAVIFQEIANYPEEGMRGMLKGGIDSREYTMLQSGIAMVFHSLIDKKIQGYDGNINLVHGLVDNFLKQIPNAFKENRILEREILPIRLRIKVEDVPVMKITYSYKEKPYSLWVYGKEQKVYAKKRPFGFTGRLVISWIIQIVIVGLIFYWIAGSKAHDVSNSGHTAAAAVSNANEAPPDAYQKRLKAAETGNPESQCDLGLMYVKGDGVAKDPAMAVQWFTKAAQQGLARAQNNLGVIYEDGNGVVKDDGEAVKWFRAAAEQGFARAQNNLATKYLNGEGVAKDSVEAVKWFEKSAEQGFPDAQFNLGVMYDNGDGTTNDPVEAAKWYRKAAEQGFAHAESSLAADLFNGEGVAKDPVEAVNWFEKAAEQGLSGAQYNLGQLYNAGTGVPMDYVQAAKWFCLAASQGNEDAKSAYSKLSEIMSPEKISQARELAKEFVPKNANQ
jgi:TPR repeat protein